MSRYILQFDFSEMNRVMEVIKNSQCTIIENETGTICKIVVEVPVNREQQFLIKIGTLHRVDLIANA